MNETLHQLWTDHSKAKFPEGFGGIDVNGVCITSVDTCASGCIDTYLNDGRKRVGLDLNRLQILKNCKSELEIVLPDLKDDALEYFSRLYVMCRLVLGEED